MPRALPQCGLRPYPMVTNSRSIVRKMNMLGNKIDAHNLQLTTNNSLRTHWFFNRAGRIFSTGLFLLLSSSCIMTRAQGEKISLRVDSLESEVAKLQRVRHDMEVLLSGKVKDLFDRLARLEEQLSTFRESLYQGSSDNKELMAEVQSLRGQLEEARHRYQSLELDQKSLAENQHALKKAQEKVMIPPLKADHFALAKKYYSANKFEDAIYLLDKFIKEYPDDNELAGQSNYFLGEIYMKMAASKNDESEGLKFYKKSALVFQELIENNKQSGLKEEALYKLGLV